MATSTFCTFKETSPHGTNIFETLPTYLRKPKTLQVHVNQGWGTCGLCVHLPEYSLPKLEHNIESK